MRLPGGVLVARSQPITSVATPTDATSSFLRVNRAGFDSSSAIAPPLSRTEDTRCDAVSGQEIG
jgi:hypothetical protein